MESETETGSRLLVDMDPKNPFSNFEEFQWTNVDDYRPIWMIDVFLDRYLGAR
jgi:hypothetical protein